MELKFHQYKYYPYERELAIRELISVLEPDSFEIKKHSVVLEGPNNIENVARLVYFQSVRREDDQEDEVLTLQAKLEKGSGKQSKRQSTRYSVHGLHEYKGKFNPQVVRSILNVLKVPQGGRVLDPFCGSGTSLAECTHMGMQAVGVDINPLAVFIANAKISALSIPHTVFLSEFNSIIARFTSRSELQNIQPNKDERRQYLESWFELDVLSDMEALHDSILKCAEKECIPVFLVIASNLLREYSLQDPGDLRIRRRDTPTPEMPLIHAFEQEALSFISRLQEVQGVVGVHPKVSKAVLSDSRGLVEISAELGQFDCAITSPPYATALPYIDTQRLSLVWLSLIPPSEILPLESRLVGSREIRGGNKKALLVDLIENTSGLPQTQADYCLKLQNALGEKDGFRRQAVPLLLYRYFVSMAAVFTSVSQSVKSGAPFALIVGSNHTILGGTRFDIDTPAHLAQLAEHYGWIHEETFPLQTYQRYGYHMNNAVSSEGLIILRKP